MGCSRVFTDTKKQAKKKAALYRSAGYTARIFKLDDGWAVKFCLGRKTRKR